MWFLMKWTKFLAHFLTERPKSESGKPTADGQVLTEKTQCHRLSQNLHTDHTGIPHWSGCVDWENLAVTAHIPLFLHQLITTKSRHHLSHAFPSYPYPYATYMLPGRCERLAKRKGRADPSSLTRSRTGTGSQRPATLRRSLNQWHVIEIEKHRETLSQWVKNMSLASRWH